MMDDRKARDLSELLGGEAREAEDGTWHVLIERGDGRVVAVSEATVEEYPDRKALASGRYYACINLK